MEGIGGAVLIFLARILDVGLGTVRIQLITARRKGLAATIGFIEVLIFILVIGSVLQGDNSLLNIVAYCSGFAGGTWLGIVIEEKLNDRLLQATVITSSASDELTAKIREAAFGALSMPGKGSGGELNIIAVMIKESRRQELEKLIDQVDEKAVISFHSLNQVRGGYFAKSK